MAHTNKHECPECSQEFDPSHGVNRRGFIRVLGTGVAAAAGTSALLAGRVWGEEATTEKSAKPKPAEDLIRELQATLSEEQKKKLVRPYDEANNRGPYRLQTYNAAILRDKGVVNIGTEYTKPQQELVRGILKSILSGEEAYERLTRHGKWDGAGSFEGNGAVLFGDPTKGEKFSWVFAGHHLTVRCDGNSEPGAAFGGPMYYGHSANGYSETNVYNYQTQKVRSVYDALNEEQRKKGVVVGDPGDRDRAIQFRPEGDPIPGITYGEMTADQKKLVEDVMRTLLEPFRKEDGDEVMALIKENGGLEKIHLAFFKDAPDQDDARWHYWRLEGPGFIWNYRVLPHVHCYVNILDA
jgi:hypothetical protein